MDKQETAESLWELGEMLVREMASWAFPKYRHLCTRTSWVLDPN